MLGVLSLTAAAAAAARGLPAQARASEASERGAAALLARAAAARAEDAFQSAAAAEVFGSLAGGGVSLDARISSRRHYQER